MPVIPITDPADPRIADYRNIPDPEMLRDRGLFVAENRLVVRALLASSRFTTRSVLVTEAAREALQDVLGGGAAPLLSGEPPSSPPVYVCPKALMEPIAGFHIHRGCLALGERPAPVTVASLLASLPDARRVVVVEAVTNADNMGAIFRNARALAADAVVVGPRCCDPLYRKAIRVSIGAALTVPFAMSEAERFESDLTALSRAGFTLVALTPGPDGRDIAAFAAEARSAKIALLVGNEGEGLSEQAQRAAGARVRIGMAPGVDSLNAATATGIALYLLAGDSLR